MPSYGKNINLWSVLSGRNLGSRTLWQSNGRDSHIDFFRWPGAHQLLTGHQNSWHQYKSTEQQYPMSILSIFRWTVHQRSMSFGLALDADIKAQDQLYSPSDTAQVGVLLILTSYGLCFGPFSMFLRLCCTYSTSKWRKVPSPFTLITFVFFNHSWLVLDYCTFDSAKISTRSKYN